MIKSINRICKEISAETGIGNQNKSHITTGFEKLDKLIGKENLNSGYLICLSSKPGLGKTTFMLNLLINSAIASNNKILLFSYDMTCRQMVERIILKLSGVNIKKLDNNTRREKSEELEHCISVLRQLDITIIDSVDSFENIKKFVLSNEKPDMVIIDGIESISYNINKDILTIKSLCRVLNIPTLFTMNLNSMPKDCDPPSLSEINPFVVKFADSIWILHREPYSIDKDTLAYSNDDAKLIVCKNRCGEIGSVPLKYQGVAHGFV